MKDPIAILTQRFAAAIAAAFPDAAGADPLITPSRMPDLADYQSNAAMPLAKKLGRPPRDVAQAIAKALDITDLAEPLTPASIAGPGFINIRLRGDVLASMLASMDAPGLGVPPASPPQTVVVDVCGVNIAKEFHVGHLRATVIGDTLARLFERLGHRVIRQNHVGDWGLQIAMISERVKRELDEGRVDRAGLSLPMLTRLYARAQAECNADTAGLAAVKRHGLGPKAEAELEAQVSGAEEARARSRAALVRLQRHDPEIYAVWRLIFDLTMRNCIATCARLHTRITHEASAGESTYAGELQPLVAEFLARGLAGESEGAIVVPLDEFGIDVPCMIRKRDGGYLYATTDIAAVRHRVMKLGADRVVYAVGTPQSLHLRQVFAAATKAGYATRPGALAPSRLEHAGFGSVLGEDGRMFKTRSGDNVKLDDLLDEAARRAEAAVAQKNPSLDARTRTLIAEAIAIAAIKYADLSNDRIKDYAFSFDRMLAFEGNTGPYLLYAIVRIRSIFRKAQERGADEAWTAAPISLSHAAEKSLALMLLRYPAAVESAAEALEPHRLCQYAYDLAGAFSSFFDACPVLAAPDDVLRRSRLRLCDLTARVLSDALETLGIPTVERM